MELESQAGDVVVSKVVPGGPADRAGIKSGDIMRELDQEDVEGMRGRPEWVQFVIEGSAPGSTLKATLERDGIERTVEIKIESHP